MRIGIDLRALDGTSRYRGIGVYAISLLNNFLHQAIKNGHNITLYHYDTQDLKEVLNEAALADCYRVQIHKPLAKIDYRLRYRLSALFGIGEPKPSRRFENLDQLDLFWQFEPEFGLPPTSFNGKTMLIAYDIIPLIMKDQYFKPPLTKSPRSWIERLYKVRRWRFYRKGLKLFNQTDVVVSISKHTKAMLSQHLSVDETKVHVIYPGPANTVKPTSEHIKEGPYIFYIGGVDARRDLDSLYLAIDKIHHKHGIKLYLAGKDFEASSVRQTIPKDSEHKIVNLGYVTDDEKADLYHHAVACVYPSKYEGFGLPVLDGFAYDCPVITYRNSSLEEVGGEAAIYAESVEDIFSAVDKLHGSKQYRKTVVEAGRKQFEKFSWTKAANETLTMIENEVSK